MTSDESRSVLLQILELARWAPSGDNTQPWRFELVDDTRLVIHGFDTRHDCVYDLDGSASQIALGALVETIAIAASMHGLRIEVSRRSEAAIDRPQFDVSFVADPTVIIDPLCACIERRSVQRRPLGTRPLTAIERATLDASVGPAHSLIWREGGGARLRMAALLFTSARLRLTMPEAYEVHARVIEWGARFSDDRVPEAAVGMDAVSASLMRWVMQKWSRVAFFNRYLAGTWLPRIQLDFVPAVACAAHFFLVANRRPEDIDDFVRAGRAMQRLWLTATRLELQMQPEVTPLIFARYVRTTVRFSTAKGMDAQAARIARRLADLIGTDARDKSVFMGRVGHGAAATARSRRRPLEQLLVRSPGVPAGVLSRQDTRTSA